MKYKSIINDVKLFDVGISINLIKKDNTLNVFSNNIELINEYPFNDSIQTIIQKGKYLFFNDINGHSYFQKDGQINKYDNYLLNIGVEHLYFIANELQQRSMCDNVINWSSEHSSIIHLIDANYIFTRTRKRKSPDVINCLNKTNGDCLWRFNLERLSENNLKSNYLVKTMIHSDENMIWIALNNNTVIALDIKTGSLIKKTSSIDNFNCDWLPSSIPLPEAMQIDKNRNLLVGLMWEFYWEINPTSGEINFYDLTDYFKKEKIRCDKPDYVLGDNHIYFISRNESKIGSFNLRTKKIDWSYKFEKNDNGVTPEILEIKGNDSMLGALDRNNTLHIFEKTQNETS